MAPKKKPEDTDDVKKAKLDLSKGVRAVGEAAKAFQSLPPRFGGNTWEEVSLNGDWDATFEEFDALDKEFLNQEQAVDRLKQKLENGDIQVRVMKVGPDGGL